MTIYNCLFCPPRNELILEKNNFFTVLIDPYPIVEDHIMIVSNDHYGCAGELEVEKIAQLEAIKEKWNNFLKNKYNKTILYEHGKAGACTASRESECHHFHLHIVPIQIEAKIEISFKAYKLNKYEDIKGLYASLGEYLYVDNEKGQHIFFIQDCQIPPHYLRTLITEAINEPQRANWERFQKTCGSKEKINLLEQFKNFYL